ncbi:hypothetical protein YC2023_075164 [Brassica napus]
MQVCIVSSSLVGDAAVAMETFCFDSPRPREKGETNFTAKLCQNNRQQACSYSEISVLSWDFGETFAIRYESVRQRTKVGLIDLVARKTQQLSDLNYEVISVSYSIYKLRENHYVSEIGSDLVFLFRRAILGSGFWLIQKELGDRFCEKVPGEPVRVRTRVRCLLKDLAASNLHLLTSSCLEVRANIYSPCFLDKNHLVLSKPETLIRFERKRSFRSLEQSVNPLVSESTFNLKAKVGLINVKVISDEVVR